MGCKYTQNIEYWTVINGQFFLCVPTLPVLWYILLLHLYSSSLFVFFYHSFLFMLTNCKKTNLPTCTDLLKNICKYAQSKLWLLFTTFFTLLFFLFLFVCVYLITYFFCFSIVKKLIYLYGYNKKYLNMF